MFKKNWYQSSMPLFLLVILLGSVLLADAKAGCWGLIVPIESVEDFCDVRCKDMSSIDILDRPNLPATLTFNPDTIWPGPAQMPAGCDPNQIMTNAMNPGLGVHALHQRGITGAGVNVAIIDQAMYLDHPEFAGKVVAYYDLAAGEQSSMHGPAVTSLLVGTNCGTAPSARVYYCAVRSWVYEVDYAQALNWIIGQNQTLPDSEKIRVVSVSAAPGEAPEGHPSEPGEPNWAEACASAEAAGILVLDCTSHRGFIGRCWYDPNDPEDIAKCTPGPRPGDPSFDPADILTPASLRTTAEEVYQGDHSYIYWGSAGASWTRPYCAGVLAMGWQIRPEISPEKMVELLFETAYVNPEGAKIINPQEFINLLLANRPRIQLSAEQITLYATPGGPNPEPQILSICNSGLGTLNWSIDYDCDWLEVYPDAGRSTGETDINDVTLGVTDLPAPDIYTCDLTISDPCGTNNPQTVRVILCHTNDVDVPTVYPTIQAAIDATVEGNTVVVAPGIYTGEGNRDLDFKGKAITVRSIAPDKPDIVAATIIDCNGTEGEPNRGFYFHNKEDTNSVLSGLTITGGYAFSGGAIYCKNSSPTISNCVLVGNVAAQGGGMDNSNNSSPTIANCTFIANSADYCGGGMHNGYSSNPTLINCIFSGNSAGYWGGGVRNHTSSPRLFNCIFTGNSATYGGAVHNENDNSNPTLINCTFGGNSAGHWGGGIFNATSSPSSPVLSNCILWENSDSGGADESAQMHGGTPVVNYNCIQGWTGSLGGIDNIGTDPCFVEPGYWDGDTWVEGDYHLLPGSPCINTGDPNYVATPGETDIDGQTRVFDGRIEMGADEFVPPIQVSVKFTPQAMNLCSKGKWVKAHLVLPAHITVQNVDLNTPATLKLLDIELNSNYMNVFLNEDGVVEIEAAFDRQVFCGLTTSNQFIELTVEGLLTSGQQFWGTNTVRIASNNFKCLAVLASYWLRTDCGKPDWCDGADLDQDAVVNFADFALLDGRCIEITTE